MLVKNLKFWLTFLVACDKIVVQIRKSLHLFHKLVVKVGIFYIQIEALWKP